MRYALGTVSALAALIVLGACSADAPAVIISQRPADSEMFFATSPNGPSGLLALYRGSLFVKDGCVFIGRPGDYSVPIWPKGFTTDTAFNHLVVRDADGATVAREGEAFEMGGGFTVEFRPKGKVEPRERQLQRLSSWLGYAIPDSCLRDDVYGVWVVGEIAPLAS